MDFISLVCQKTHKLWKTRGTNGQTCFAASGKSIHKVNGGNYRKKRPEIENFLAIHKLSPKMSLELICYFLVAEKLETSGSQTFLNWKCHQLCSNSETTENNWQKKHHYI